MFKKQTRKYQPQCELFLERGKREKLAESKCEEAKEGDGVGAQAPAEVTGPRLLLLLLGLHELERKNNSRKQM